MTLDEFGILTVNVPTAAGFASSLNILGDVSADSVSTKNVYLSNANASLPSLAFSDSQGLYAPGTNQLGLATNGVNRILVDSNGRVGIGNGTTAPTYTLDVTGTTATTNALVSGYLRDALTPSTYDISGGNISNSGTITSVGRVSTGSLFRVNSSSNFIYRYGASKATTAPSYGICYATSVANGNGLITYTADTANGDSFTVASNGLYLVSVSIGGGSVITLDENYAATQQIIVTTADASGLIGWNSSGPNENGATFTGYLRSGNTYRLKSYTAFNASWTGTAKSKLFIFPMYTTA
jgi:hypothetical protein